MKSENLLQTFTCFTCSADSNYTLSTDHFYRFFAVNFYRKSSNFSFTVNLIYCKQFQESNNKISPPIAIELYLF